MALVWGPSDGGYRSAYSGGCAPSTTVSVCRCPDGLTQVTETFWPGCDCPVSKVSSDGEVTACPSTEMITSPLARPASAAPVRHSTPSTSVPESTGAILDGTPMFWLLARQPCRFCCPPKLPNPPWPLFCFS